MRLINADAFIRRLREACEDKATRMIVDKMCVFTEVEATFHPVDAELIKHGKWKIKTINTYDLAYGTTGYEPVYQCSVCGGVEESYLRLEEPIMPEDASFPRYCSNCGARMDEEDL